MSTAFLDEPSSQPESSRSKPRVAVPGARAKPIPQPIEAFDNPDQGEESTVHEIYEQIAPHFAQTRHKPWPLITSFLTSLPPHSIGLDSGAGNGKYLPTAHAAGHTMVALDRSKGLLDLAQKQDGGEDIVRGDLGARCWREGVFDFIISVAAIHHLSTPLRRRQAVQALLPPLRLNRQAPYSRFFIYVWAYEQGQLSKRAMGSAAGPSSTNHTISEAATESLGKEEEEQTGTQPEQGDRVQDVLVPWVLKNPPASKAKSTAPPKGKTKTRKTKSRSNEPHRASDLEQDETISEPVPSAEPGSGAEPGPESRYPEVQAVETTKTEQPQAQVQTDTAKRTGDSTGGEEGNDGQKGEKVYHRYYHLFVQGELRDLVIEAAKEEGYRIRPDFDPDPRRPQNEEIGDGPIGEGEKWLKVRGVGWEADNWWIEAEVGLGPYTGE